MENLRKQISDEVLNEIFQFATKQQLEKVIYSLHSTRQMKTICTQILAKRTTQENKATSNYRKLKPKNEFHTLL